MSKIGKGGSAPATSGAIHEPVAEGTAVHGDTRERMVMEDGARLS